MNARIDEALSRSQVVEITTTGRRTGAPRRIAIYVHRLDEGLFVSGRPSPRKRAWLANLEADPRLTVHRRDPRVDLRAVARVVTDPIERRRVLEKVARAWGRSDVDTMAAQSPLIEVAIETTTEASRAA